MLESREKEERIKFSLTVTVRYGAFIPELAKQVQRNVIKRIKETTGFEVDSVDIHIQELEFPN